jgi:hypothetical protein
MSKPERCVIVVELENGYLISPNGKIDGATVDLKGASIAGKQVQELGQTITKVFEAMREKDLTGPIEKL